MKQSYLFSRTKRVVVRFDPALASATEIAKALAETPFGIEPAGPARAYYRRGPLLVSAYPEGNAELARGEKATLRVEALPHEVETVEPAGLQVASVTLLGRRTPVQGRRTRVELVVPADFHPATRTLAIDVEGAFGTVTLQLPIGEPDDARLPLGAQ